MTAQSMETLYIDGKRHWMASEPFGDYLEKLDHPPKLLTDNTACWRGYYGNWKIRNDKLYLTRLDANIATGDDDVTWDVVGIDYFFPDKKIVFADWFTGEIRVPLGNEIQYVHMGYESLYEKDLIIHIVEGVVISRDEIENK